ncbi:MAG: fluoride efflux transporter CrcB [Proteobacteria bacterium]|nr:fluoride efflux transporter CrcB [Desulfobulbaceae bacterium]MBU4152806.1 fluoride efflux transporter CrcB [Pseudomonadota bacterium]MDP2105433.1 fluoride efflux transporter CrcB [Desulfobulbaceae bacterium]
MTSSILAISLGASAGAVSRWLLGVFFNTLFPMIPPGTLTANLIGCYLVGIAVVFFASHPILAPEWRLLVITGFLGGLTTFSTFSAEVISLIQQGRLLWAGGSVALHVTGSLAMTMLGMTTGAAIQRI